jgi:hypothetical protein
MPQLDFFTFPRIVLGSVILLFCFFFFMIVYIIPKIAAHLKNRRKYDYVWNRIGTVYSAKYIIQIGLVLFFSLLVFSLSFFIFEFLISKLLTLDKVLQIDMLGHNTTVTVKQYFKFYFFFSLISLALFILCAVLKTIAIMNTNAIETIWLEKNTFPETYFETKISLILVLYLIVVFYPCFCCIAINATWFFNLLSGLLSSLLQ